MVDLILSKYWTPKGTPLWRHHFPLILIAVLVVATIHVLQASEPKDFLVSVGAIVLGQAILGYFARKRYGDVAPPTSFYSKK
ncbi:MAG: hypothetical protein EOO52_13365 [Gammaproteobacteria bacterium]|nr:MAG: hypothetical protein EOO52_13365 [Gammaproteobacteria bacterium]